MNTSIILVNLLIVFSLMGVGFVAGKMKFFSANVSKDLSALLMRITLPCTVLLALVREFEPRLVRDSVIVFVVTLIFTLLFMGAALIITKKLRLPGDQVGVWVLAACFGNTGFIGFPLVSALFGNDGLFIAALGNMAYVLLEYTLCIKLITGYSGKAGTVNWKSILLTPINIAIAIGLLLFFLQIPIPSGPKRVLEYLSGITTPLSMMIIGLNLAEGDLLAVFKEKSVILATVAKLLVFPLVSVLLLLPFPALSASARGVIVLSIAMPSASLSTVFAHEYGGDPREASSIVFMTTLFCLVSVPLVLLLL